MRIAQIAPLAESIPPQLYDGTERVVAWLVDELVELGHDVTLLRLRRTPITPYEFFLAGAPFDRSALSLEEVGHDPRRRIGEISQVRLVFGRGECPKL